MTLITKFTPSWRKPLAYFVYARTSKPNDYAVLCSTEQDAFNHVGSIRVLMYQNKGLTDWSEDGGDSIPITCYIKDLCEAINRFKVYPVKLISTWCKLNNWTIPPSDVEWPSVITSTEEATIVSKDGKAELVYNENGNNKNGDNENGENEFEPEQVPEQGPEQGPSSEFYDNRSNGPNSSSDELGDSVSNQRDVETASVEQSTTDQ